MERFAGFVARHPNLIGVAFAVLVGAGAYNAYQGGRMAQRIAGMVGDDARAASEALGG